MSSHNKDSEEIAARLKQVRKFYGLNQKEFAEKAGFTPSQYNNWESGRQGLSLPGARRFLKIYDVSLDFIFTGRLSTLPENMRKAFLPSPKDNKSNKSNDNPDS